MSGAESELRLRMTELGRRYLDRTASEMPQLQALIDQVPEGDAAVYKAIEVLAHRIRGSGAMFAFDFVSAAALGVEMLAVDAKLGMHPDRVAVRMRLAAQAKVLEFVVQATKEQMLATSD